MPWRRRVKPAAALRRATTAVGAASGAVLLALTPVTAAHAALLTPASPQASQPASALLNWLAHLPNRGSGQGHVASGYFAGYSTPTSVSASGFGGNSQAEIGEVQAATGQSPAVAACDYGLGNGINVDTTCNSYLESWAQQGGLVSVSLHLPNPDPTGTLSAPMPAAEFEDLFNTGSTSAVHKQLDTDLDAVAAGLKQLATSANGQGGTGIPVLFRPLMEMNCSCFWWGGQGQSDFKALWTYMFNRINTDLGSDNTVLWVYSANDNSAASGPGSATYYYPGAGLVDLVGLDVYNPDPAAITDYPAMLALGKPFAFTEIGAPTPSGATAPTPGFDFTTWEHAIRTRFPETTFFLSWNSEWGLNNACRKDSNGDYYTCAGVSPTNNSFSALMNDPVVINRGAVRLADITDPDSVPLVTYTSPGGAVPLDDFDGTDEAGSNDSWGSWSAPGASGTGINGGPWAVTEWASRGAYSLKADVTLGQGQSGALDKALTTPLDLTGQTRLTATARSAPWTAPTAGMTAKLYVIAGPAHTWYDDGAVAVSTTDLGTPLALDLTRLPATDLRDVTQIGVDFIPTTGASGGTAIYVDDVRVAGPELLAGFEGSTDTWGGWSPPTSAGTGITGGPWSVSEWSSQGADSLKADVNLNQGQSGGFAYAPSASYDFTDRSKLTITARVAAWTAPAAGMTAKLYVIAGPDHTWYDDGPVPVTSGSSGTPLTLDLTRLPAVKVSDITQIGVDFVPTTGASGSTAIYVDGLTVQ